MRPLSYTSMTRWLECGRKQEYHLNGEPAALSGYFARGIAGHKGLEAWANGATVPDAIETALRCLFTFGKGEVPEEADGDWQWWTGEVKNIEVLDGAALGTVMEAYCEGRERPDRAEVGFEDEISGTIDHAGGTMTLYRFPVFVAGRIDAIYGDQFIDWKFVGKSSYRPDNDQLLFYSLGTGIMPHNYHAFHILPMDGSDPFVHSVYVTYADCRQLLEQKIVPVYRAISAGIFPANTAHWKCSPKWCEYYDVCRARRTL